MPSDNAAALNAAGRLSTQQKAIFVQTCNNCFADKRPNDDKTIWKRIAHDFEEQTGMSYTYTKCQEVMKKLKRQHDGRRRHDRTYGKQGQKEVEDGMKVWVKKLQGIREARAEVGQATVEPTTQPVANKPKTQSTANSSRPMTASNNGNDPPAEPVIHEAIEHPFGRLPVYNDQDIRSLQHGITDLHDKYREQSETVKRLEEEFEHQSGIVYEQDRQMDEQERQVEEQGRQIDEQKKRIERLEEQAGESRESQQRAEMLMLSLLTFKYQMLARFPNPTTPVPNVGLPASAGPSTQPPPMLNQHRSQQPPPSPPPPRRFLFPDGISQQRLYDHHRPNDTMPPPWLPYQHLHNHDNRPYRTLSPFVDQTFGSAHPPTEHPATPNSTHVHPGSTTGQSFRPSFHA